jgi:hypothetical protein
MTRSPHKKSGLLTVLGVSVMVLFFCFSYTAGADEYSIGVDVSPNIINIASERLGDIRVFTDMRYSAFIANEGIAFIYVNGYEDSVENIRATRDSLGNLILKFSLEYLLVLGAEEEEEVLLVDDINEFEVVVSYNDGDEYEGTGEVLLIDKGAR